MKKVFKYSILPKKHIEIIMPEGAEILCVHTIGLNSYIWALVEESNPSEIRRFQVVGTGWDIDEMYTENSGIYYIEYIGTFYLDNGALVFHVFENKKRSIQ